MMYFRNSNNLYCVSINTRVVRHELGSQAYANGSSISLVRRRVHNNFTVSQISAVSEEIWYLAQ